MSFKLYIAGASAEIEEIEPRIARLRAAGAEITGDWCADIRAAGTANAGLTDQERFRYADRDRWAVLGADILWLLVPSKQSIGCWVELGMASGHRVPIVVSDDDKRTIFTALAGRKFPTHDEAEAYLASVARDWAIESRPA